jgi:hypothetical protein
VSVIEVDRNGLASLASACAEQAAVSGGGFGEGGRIEELSDLLRSLDA